MHLLPGHDGESEVFGHRLTQSHPQRVRQNDTGSVNASIGRGRLLCQEVVRVTELFIANSLSFIHLTVVLENMVCEFKRVHKGMLQRVEIKTARDAAAALLHDLTILALSVIDFRYNLQFAQMPNFINISTIIPTICYVLAHVCKCFAFCGGAC